MQETFLANQWGSPPNDKVIACSIKIIYNTQKKSTALIKIVW